MTGEQLNEPEEVIDVEAEESVQSSPQYGVGPFSIREIALAGVWLVAFVVSFFPVTASFTAGAVSVQLTWASVWLSGLSWVLTIGVPTVAVFLVVLRRLSPDGIRRVGSLSVDQFASVAFSVSAVVWLGWVWETVAIAIESGGWVRSWVIWVELVLMVAGVVLTVLAPFIPPFSEDFQQRAETVAHRVARPIRPVVARPARVAAPVVGDQYGAAQPYDPADPYASATGTYPATGSYAAADPYAAQGDASSAETGAYAPPQGDPYVGQTDAYAPQADAYAADPYTAASPADTYAESDIDTTAVSSSDTGEYGLAGDQAEWKPAHTRGTFESAEAAPVRHQAFWALVPEERDIVDDAGIPLFRIGPSAWALVIEDRGHAFIVRHEDGRIGHLHDVSGVTRG